MLHALSGRATQPTQVLLSMTYKNLLREGATLPTFDDVGFSAFSQSNEDGILLYIFSLIGTCNKRLIDIGCGAIHDSNAANLLINHGWSGLLIDGDRRMIEIARGFYSEWPETSHAPPALVHAFVTAENVERLVRDNDFAGEVDLLSIDLDGIDYWIWKALDCTKPRVAIMEYQSFLGAERAITVPYRPDFQKTDYEENRQYPNYLGASLAALRNLGNEKGYRLVGCNRLGYNAFFVRRDLGEDWLPAVSVEDCLRRRPPVEPEARWESVRNKDWVEV
jgi:SAM-dependent methyltransferase